MKLLYVIIPLSPNLTHMDHFNTTDDDVQRRPLLVKVGDLFTVENKLYSTGYQVQHVSKLGTRIVGHQHIRRNGQTVIRANNQQILVWRKTINEEDNTVAWKWMRLDNKTIKHEVKFGLAFNYHNYGLINDLNKSLTV